jgi:hypothetical protein
LASNGHNVYFGELVVVAKPMLLIVFFIFFKKEMLNLSAHVLQELLAHCMRISLLKLFIPLLELVYAVAQKKKLYGTLYQMKNV